jgi:hypothetical protein
MTTAKSVPARNEVVGRKVKMIFGDVGEVIHIDEKDWLQIRLPDGTVQQWYYPWVVEPETLPQFID